MSQLVRSKKALQNIGLAAIVAASLFSSPALAQKQGLARETLEQLINVPSKDLSDDDLSLRILLNKRLVEDNVQQIAGIKLKPLLRADRREQKRRGGSQTASTSVDDTDQTADILAPKQTNNPEANRQARDQLRDTRKANALTIDELQERITKSEAILAMGGIRLKRTNQLTSRVAADRKELSIKKNAALEQQRAAEAAQKAENDRLVAIEAEQRAEEERQAKADAEARRRAADARATRQQTQQNDQANQFAREILRDNRPSHQLSAAELNQRITLVSQALSYPDLRRRLSRQLKSMLAEDKSALAASDTIRQRQPRDNANRNGANQIARGLLRDQRPAENLGLPELRDRVARTRDILQNTNLRQRLSNQLLDRLARDRDELRSRIAQNQGRGQNDRLGSAQGGDITSDRRPAFRLSDKQLDLRIQKTGSLLKRARLRQNVRRQLENRLADDRNEKRRRLLAARQERRQQLRNQRSNNGGGFSVDLGNTGITFSFGNDGVQIGPNSRLADNFNPTHDIIAAEVNEADIQRQLLAPPRRNIQRSYSLNEFRARPDLRSIMPGIELDTIRFGTNEAFISAEEIDNLDAIGEMIEQIVYARPEEVFVIEGHTDAVGTAEHNYGLSVARADAVRGALLDYFNISPRNIVAIGYGERYLRIPTQRAEQENRRVSVRRITPLLTGQLR